MKTKIFTYLRLPMVTIALLLAYCASAMAQAPHLLDSLKREFIDISVSQMVIDSVMPRVSLLYSMPWQHSDSVYSVRLLYPEYVPLTRRQVKDYRRLAQQQGIGDSVLAPKTPQVTLSRVTERTANYLQAEFNPIVEQDGRLYFVSSFLPQIISSPAGASPVATSASQYQKGGTRTSVLSNGVWAKIRVPKTGFYELTQAVVKQAGFSDLSKVKIYGYGGNLIPERLTQDYLSSHDDLMEVASCYIGGRRVFYAQGSVNWQDKTTDERTQNPYSDYGYYFITHDGGAPAMCSEADLVALYNADPYNYHSLYEVDRYAWKNTGRKLVDGQEVLSGQSQVVSFTVPAGNSAARLTISLTTEVTATVAMTCNDKSLGNISLTKSDNDHFAETVRQVNIKDLDPSHDNVLNISLTPQNSKMRLDYLSLAFDVAAGAALGGVLPAPEYVHNITNQNHHADDPRDLIIIVPTSQKWVSQAERLGQLHARYDGMTYRVIPADELYNEYSSGTPDVSAYRRYFKMFYDRATTDGDIPKYVLLFGSSLWDNRMLTVSREAYSPDDYLLCYETYASNYYVSSSVIDDFITILADGKTVHADGNYDSGMQMDVASGRLTATTFDEAKTFVDKIERYIQNVNDNDWQTDVMFIGGDNDEGMHMRQINENADMVIARRQGMKITKVMSDAYTRKQGSTGKTYPDVHDLITKQQNSGALIMNYGGHAGPTQLSNEKIVMITDAKTYQGNNYSLWFTAACETAPFDQALQNTGESMVKNAAGGAVGFIGTARTVLATYNTALDKVFMKYILDYERDANGNIIAPYAMGEALRVAKNSLITTKDGEYDRSINKHQYHLLGDPALRIALPRYHAVVDMINDKPVNEVVTIKGNDIVTVKGHITDMAGVKQTGFNGIAKMQLKDSEQTIVCRNNSGWERPFEYRDRINTLYKGSATVADGEFTFVFRAPTNFAEDGGTGLITLYAVDAQHTMAAKGECHQFRMDGIQPVENDSVGPVINCYLNTPSFTNGSRVSKTPFFVAELFSDFGLDVTGNTIGHSLELIIDDDNAKTYDLTDYFTYDNGSYTSGQAYYVIPRLEQGSHTLRFRAWDLQGNMGQSILTFVVDHMLAPSLSDVFVYPNPVKENATFCLATDFQGSEAQVDIEIFDSSGRQLRTLSWDTHFATDTNMTKLTWTGVDLPAGVYVYRARIRSGSYNESTKAKKLIVL